MKTVNVNADMSSRAPNCTAPSPEQLAEMLRRQAEAEAEAAKPPEKPAEKRK